MRKIAFLLLLILVLSCTDKSGEIIIPNPRGCKYTFVNKEQYWVGLAVHGLPGWAFLPPYDSAEPYAYTRYACSGDGINLLGQKWTACVAMYEIYPSDIIIDSGFITVDDTIYIEVAKLKESYRLKMGIRIMIKIILSIISWEATMA